LPNQKPIPIFVPESTIGMAKAKEPKKTGSSTDSAEERIIEAARKVFTQKGYAAARNRDIAEEAGINMALLHYYFRTKEKLFGLVMKEKMQQFFGAILPVANNECLTLDEKLNALVGHYIDLLVENPDLPIFLLSEVRANPEKFKTEIPVNRMLNDTSLVRQIRDKRPELDPVHFIVSILGMTVFPFAAKPVLFPDEAKFKALMEERKTLIVAWTKSMLET